MSAVHTPAEPEFTSSMVRAANGAASSRSVIASRAWPDAISNTSRSPSTPNDLTSTAARINAAFGPFFCTVSTETPARAAIFARVVPA